MDTIQVTGRESMQIHKHKGRLQYFQIFGISNRPSDIPTNTEHTLQPWGCAPRPWNVAPSLSICSGSGKACGKQWYLLNKEKKLAQTHTGRKR